MKNHPDLDNLDNEQLVKLAGDGDADARSAIVEHNMGLIWSIVRRFHNRGYDPEDLFQIGSIGLIKAADKFDPSYNVKFSTYAVPMILGEIKRYLRDDGIIKVSRSIKETSNKVRYAREEMSKQLGREPSLSEISARTGFSSEEIAMASEASMTPGYLYDCQQEAGDSHPMLIETIQSEDGENETGIVDRLALRQALGSLKQRDRQIIMLRYFKEKTQVQIAKMLGISQVQVSRIEKRILKDIKSKLI